MTGQNDIARTRQQIAAEYLSAQLGLSGLAEGTNRHSFITHKMERMGESFETLAEMMSNGTANLVGIAGWMNRLTRTHANLITRVHLLKEGNLVG